MELHCDSKTTISNTQDDKTLNVNAEEFQPKRLAAAVAEQRIRNFMHDKNEQKTFDLHHHMGGEKHGNLKVT